MGKTYWTKEKIELLNAYFQAGFSYPEISKKMGKSTDSLDHARRRYGLIKPETSAVIIGEDEVVFSNKIIGKKILKQEVHELARLVGEEIQNNYKKVKLPEPKLQVSSKSNREEISILDISDVHVGMINEIYDADSGKKVITYDHAIFEKELATLQDSIFQIHGILSNSYKLKKLVIFVLGDVITNDRIFPEQVFEVEECVGQQIWKVIPVFAKFFNNLLAIYEEIEVVCVVGNHGRSNPHHYNEPVENNFEYHIYKCWEEQFKDSKRVKIVVPNTRRYVHTVGKWKHLVEHGDQLRGFTSNAIEKQLKDIYVNVGGFDVMHFGHLHQLKEDEISDKVIVKQNGCWIYKDGYAWNKFKKYSIPKQHFFGCNSKRPETWAYKIDLRG